MSIRNIGFVALMLSVMACAEAPTADPTDPNEPAETTVDQEIGITPSCPVGQTVVVWVEPFGACGGCTVRGVAGQPGHQFAACSGNISGTKRPIQNVCTTPCELL
jgi:hypothetical protein